MTYAMVMSTTNNLGEAEAIAQALLTDGLAACIQIMPVVSHYSWQGEHQNSAEYLLLIKGKAASFNDIQACITKIHSYSVPEIIQIPIVAGSANYLEWITSVSK